MRRPKRTAASGARGPLLPRPPDLAPSSTAVPRLVTLQVPLFELLELPGTVVLPPDEEEDGSVAGEDDGSDPVEEPVPDPEALEPELGEEGYGLEEDELPLEGLPGEDDPVDDDPMDDDPVDDPVPDAPEGEDEGDEEEGDDEEGEDGEVDEGELDMPDEPVELPVPVDRVLRSSEQPAASSAKAMAAAGTRVDFNFMYRSCAKWMRPWRRKCR